MARIAYAAEPPLTMHDVAAALPGAVHVPRVEGVDTDESFGDPEAALATAAAVVDALYTTPPEYHAAMEPHARMAEWHGDHLLFHSTSRRNGWPATRALAQALGVPDGKVRLVNAYVGGGFGGKAYFRYDSALCAWAARALGRPVKLVLSREQSFILGGRRGSAWPWARTQPAGWRR